MKINSFLQLFTVKDRKFFPLFKQQGEYILDAAKLLTDLINEKDEEAQRSIYRNIKTRETQGDVVTGKIYDELNKSFVTPFDRDDIQVLTSYLDSFLDLINDTGKRLVMYQPCRATTHMYTMANLVVEDAQHLRHILDDLEFINKRQGNIVTNCKRIKEIEHECDDLYELSIVELFKQEKDPIMVIKLREILMSLEEATDRAQHVSSVIRRIIVKLA
jgi:predicted phosphate transport protein (TIGR00153 family)